jgi:hypothetical protein
MNDSERIAKHRAAMPRRYHSVYDIAQSAAESTNSKNPTPIFHSKKALT